MLAIWYQNIVSALEYPVSQICFILGTSGRHTLNMWLSNKSPECRRYHRLLGWVWSLTQLSTLAVLLHNQSAYSQQAFTLWGWFRYVWGLRGLQGWILLFSVPLESVGYRRGQLLGERKVCFIQFGKGCIRILGIWQGLESFSQSRNPKCCYSSRRLPVK